MIFPQWLLLSRPWTGAVGKSVILLGLFAGHSALPAKAESEVYVPYSGIVQGAEGAAPVDVYVLNETNGPLECQAALAHWYSDDLGRIAPGDALALTLWHEGETGVLNLMNATRHRMPVEAVWCTSQTARARLDLPITAGETPANLSFACRANTDNLRCEATGG